MKKKKTTYLLLVAVVLIWSIIFFKVFNFKGQKENTDFTINDTPIKKQLEINYDTIKLNLNYLDPFLGYQINRTPKKTSGKNTTVLKKPVKNPEKNIEPQWPLIMYSGLIRSEGKTQGLFKVEGKQLLLLETSSHDKIKIEKLYKDSALVSFMGKPKMLTIY